MSSGCNARRIVAIKRAALLTAGLQRLGMALASCFEGWATFAIVGACQPSLSEADSLSVVILMVGELTRKNPTTYIGNSPTTQGHRRMNYFDGIQPNRWANIAMAMQETPLVLLGVLLPVLRLYSTSSHQALTLKIFYLLALVKAAFTAVSLLLNLYQREVLLPNLTFSLRIYHEEVRSTALARGFIIANNIDFLDLVLDKLIDYPSAHDVPNVLKESFEDFVEFLYNHPTGVPIVNSLLSSDNPPKQRSLAAHIVGFWANKTDLHAHKALLSELVDNLDINFPGLVVAHTFKTLASKNSKLLLVVPEGHNMRVVDILIDHLGECRKMSPVLLKTLQIILRKDEIILLEEAGCPAHERLKTKLQQLIQKSDTSTKLAVETMELMKKAVAKKSQKESQFLVCESVNSGK